MKRSGSVSGAVSLVMIFCVLCLAVFAVLTLSTAKREDTLSARAAERAAAYYAADADAVAWVAEMTAATALAGRVPDGAVIENSFPVGDDQTLEVEMRYEWNTGVYRILRWQTVYSGDWEINDTIEVWDGE